MKVSNLNYVTENHTKAKNVKELQNKSDQLELELQNVRALLRSKEQRIEELEAATPRPNNAISSTESSRSTNDKPVSNRNVVNDSLKTEERGPLQDANKSYQSPTSLNSKPKIILVSPTAKEKVKVAHRADNRSPVPSKSKDSQNKLNTFPFGSSTPISTGESKRQTQTESSLSKASNRPLTYEVVKKNPKTLDHKRRTSPSNKPGALTNSDYDQYGIKSPPSKIVKRKQGKSPNSDQLRKGTLHVGSLSYRSSVDFSLDEARKHTNHSSNSSTNSTPVATIGILDLQAFSATYAKTKEDGKGTV